MCVSLTLHHCNTQPIILAIKVCVVFHLCANLIVWSQNWALVSLVR